MSRPAAFLDRDGVLNVRAAEHHYVCAVEDFEWLPGAVRVVSNQRGLARGLVSEQTLRDIEARIQDALEPHGCRIEAFRYCPHDHDARCACRKPQPGLLLDAAAELDLELAASWMIGDSASDIAAGRAAGCRTALVGGADPGDGGADLVAGSLDAASELILARRPSRVA